MGRARVDQDSRHGPGDAPLSGPWMLRLEQLPGWVVFFGVGVLYVGFAQYVLWLNDPVRNGAGFWPSAGVTLAALLLLSRRQWPWVLAAVLVGEIAGDTLLADYPLIPSIWWGLANIVEPLLAASLLRRRMGSTRLVPMSNLVRFLAYGVVVGPLIGATVGTTGTAAEYGVPWLSTWVKFAVGDGIGVLVVAPLLLCVAQPANQRRSLVEASALTALVGGMIVGQFHWTGDLEIVLPYVMIPALIWAAMRFGVRAVAVAGFALGHGASLANGLGQGPLALNVTDGHAITALQLFVGIALATGLVVAAVSDDLIGQTEVRRLLSHQTRHDPLTGLPNRLLLMDRLDAALNHSQETGHPVGLLFIDLDHFKVVNDRLGHHAGDAVLMEVARRLELTCRPRDTVARFGGDEFVVLCPDLGADEELDEIASRFVAAGNEPIHHAGSDIIIGTSIGVVLAHGTGHPADVLLRDGDSAMYLAKEQGRNRFVRAAAPA